MTEDQIRAKVVSTMAGWIGRKESNGTHKMIIDIYNAHKPLARKYKVKYTDEWCATAVSAAFIKAGLTDIAPTECSCAEMIDLYKARGRWQERDDYRPKPGDIVMYYWKDGKNFATTDCTGRPNHVGIVSSVYGNTIKVIEGNKTEAVGIRHLDINGRYIRGYCLPDYAKKAAQNGSTITKATVDPAKAFNKLYARKYTVTAAHLNMRAGAGLTKKVIKVINKGQTVTCYGYYTKSTTTTWLYVRAQDGTVGFCSMKYLK